MDKLLEDVKLSIIIPVYNGEKFIKKALDKILQISIKKEVIVIDDKSTDNSLKILQQYGNQIIIIGLSSNHGAGYARNQGLKIATGNFVSFIDIDDDFELDMHTQILSKMITTGADIGICNYDIVNFDGDVQKSKYNLDFDNLKQTEVIRYYLLNKITPLIWVSVYRISLAKKIMFKNVRLAEDVIYQFHAILNAKKTCFVNEPLYHYFRHAKSTLYKAKISALIESHFKIFDSITPVEKEMLEKKYPVEYEYFYLSSYTYFVHVISALKIKRHEKKQLIRRIINSRTCNAIIKNQYFRWFVKFEFWFIKVFGIGLHLFIFPAYQFLYQTLIAK